MRIVHFSDWHGRQEALPLADIYICTGDMLPNFHWPISAAREELLQRDWISSQIRLRDLFESPNAPCIVVRGNHDFTDLAPYVGGEVYEIGVKPTVFTLRGLVFGGVRGVPWINDMWSDELGPPEEYDLWRTVPSSIDVLVTHGPPSGVLDDGYGSRRIASYVNRHPCKLHLFGHIHEHGGEVVAYEDMRFSNAATTFNVIDL